jgi:hypothetical protein
LTSGEVAYYKRTASSKSANFVHLGKARQFMAAVNLKRAGNELGARTTYEIFLEQEGLPALRGFHIDDINALELHPWARTGGRGLYLNLEGSEGINDCFVAEIAPGKSLEPQRHMFKALIYVVSGRGATSIWQEGGKKQTFEWSEGALFSPPLTSISTARATSRCGSWR